MPAKNTVKIYVEDGYYHVYNRGVEKRIIFIDEQDYKVFLRYLKEYLSPPPDLLSLAKEVSFKGRTFKGIARQTKNFTTEIELIAFCLMPNHFHLLLLQRPTTAMTAFLRALLTRYTMYFNKRHHRVGSLFQSRYKAALVESDEYLLHLSRYIHRNPRELGGKFTVYSSYEMFLGKHTLSWLKPDVVLSFFTQQTLPILQKVNTYQDFVESYEQDDGEVLGALSLDAA